jgi:glutamate/aspartate transport system substrate-binding protein
MSLKPVTRFSCVALAFATCLALPAVTQAQTTDAALERIKANKEVVIGFRQSSIPFSYLDSSQQPIGFTVDLCREVVETLKQKLQLPDLKIKMVAVDLSTFIPLLQNGTVDMECGSTVHTLRRAAQVDFSLVTAAASDQLLVKTDSPVKEIEDLANKAVAVPAGSTNAALVQTINTRQQLNLRIVMVKDQAEGFLAVSTGRVEAYVTDNVILYGLKKRAPDSEAFRVTGRLLSYLPYGIVVAPNNSGLLAVVNETLATLDQSGKASELYTKWFAQVGMPISELTQSIYRINSIPQ